MTAALADERSERAQCDEDVEDDDEEDEDDDVVESSLSSVDKSVDGRFIIEGGSAERSRRDLSRSRTASSNVCSAESRLSSWTTWSNFCMVWSRSMCSKSRSDTIGEAAEAASTVGRTAVGSNMLDVIGVVVAVTVTVSAT